MKKPAIDHKGYFKVRIGEVARASGFDYKSLAALLREVDPEGRGLHPSTVSEHLNQEWADRIDGRIALLYCRALDCSLDELWTLQR